MVVDLWTFRKCVAFLVQEPRKGGTPEPKASAFVISYTIPYRAYFLVTARHNLEYCNKDKPLLARFNSQKGKFIDIPVPADRWVPHPTTDVAIYPLDMPEEVSHATSFVPLDAILSEQDLSQNQLFEGMPVFVPSLFAQIADSSTIQPILRTGILSLLPEEKLSIKLGPKTQNMTSVYLIECLIWGGCSGAPVFVDNRWKDKRTRGIDAEARSNVCLLGLINGHYPQPCQLSSENEDPDLIVDLNAGISVVIPSVDILKLLEDEVLKEHCKKCWKDPPERYTRLC